MSSNIRKLLHKKIVQLTGLQNPSIPHHFSLKLNKTTNSFTYELPLQTSTYNLRSHTDALTSQPLHDELFKSISLSHHKNQDSLSISLNRDVFVKQILESNRHTVSPPQISDSKNNILLEFSSPNIAKPFHVGHLRSTIIGSYLSNLHKFLNKNVRNLNYLGDWGTQLGFIILGTNLLNISDEKLRENPIKKLYEAYVHANKLSESDPLILDAARDIFQQLEKGDTVNLGKWENFKGFTVDELKKTYERLGVVFDEYAWESSYNATQITDVIRRMEELDLLNVDEHGRRCVRINERRNLPIIKSDGSTLYVTRDIAAAIERAEKFDFDVAYYVVENGQHDHFSNLFEILKRMKFDWASKLQHVKFGRISGMSTRKGTAVFLSDFLDEARNAMRDRQGSTATTKVDLSEGDGSSDILGMSAILIHDLKQRRTKDYKFSWDVALDIKGESGVKLQYTHCRLSGIEDNSGATLPASCDPSLLTEPIVNDLVGVISQFDEAILTSYESLESCYLAKYLFNLSHTVNKTIEEVRVKGEPSEISEQRLLMYHSAKNVLNTGMKLLGLTPLRKM